MSTIAECSLAELKDELVAHAAHMSAGMCRYLELVGECERRGACDGWDSTAEWLAWRCGLTRRTANEHVRVASALEELPLINSAFACGELSYAKVRALTRVGRPEKEDELLSLASAYSASQLERALRAYQRVMTEEAREVQEWERLTYYWDEDGALVVHGRLAPEDGALFLKALEAGRERLWNEEAAVSASGSAEPGSLPRRPSNVDALVAVAEDALDYESDAHGGGDRFQVVLHVEQQALERDGAGSSLLADGPAVAPETARRLACDASIVELAEHAGLVLGVGRKTRKIGLALRRALEARDGCCRFPGCTSRRVQTHHIKHWARGGETELYNLVLLCRRHHRLVHEGGWTVDRRHRFRNRSGRRVPDAPAQPPGSATALRDGNAGLDIGAASYKTGDGDPLHLDLAVDDLLRAIRRPRQWQAEAREIVERLSTSFRGRAYGRYTVNGAWWYGSVCNGPRKVVVQVEISGTIDHRPPAHEQWVDDLAHEIRAAFEHRGWPPTCEIIVQLQSAERLRRDGWPTLG
jgi:hypothetical protein